MSFYKKTPFLELIETPDPSTIFGEPKYAHQIRQIRSKKVNYGIQKLKGGTTIQS